MTDIIPMNGIVGVFDILGYQSFLENNEPEQAAREVLGTLSRVDQSVIDSVAEKLPGFKHHKPLLESIRWLIFSDTILITTGAVEVEIPSKQLLRWLIFLRICAELQLHMFQFGLPCRAAISIGKFLVIQNCFAGRSIVDAYGLAKHIDLAAAILSNEAGELFRSLLSTVREGKHPPVFDELVVDYLVPFKGGQEKRFATLNYLQFMQRESEDTSSLQNDLVQMVYRSFWGHNKEIPSDASRKAKNTEQYFRFLKCRFPDSFAGASSW